MPPSDRVKQQKSLEEAVTRWLVEERRRRRLKDVTVFAATRKDQQQLLDLQRYLDHLDDVDQPTMAKPLIGRIPLKLSRSVVHDVRRHVLERAAAEKPNYRTLLLCNNGHTGTGKTTMLQQTTVEGV